MKLVFLINNGKEVAGGSYAQYKFGEYLAKRGNYVTIFGGDRPVFFKNYQLPKKLKLNFRGKFPKLFKGWEVIDTIWKKIYLHFVIIPYMKKEKPDYIVGFLREEAITTVKLSKKLGIKSINFIFETPIWMKKQIGNRFKNEYRGKFKKSWEKTKFAYQETNFLIPNSELTRKECSQWLKRIVEVPIYPGMDFIRKKSNIREKNQIIYIGRLNEYKNVDILIEALSMVKDAPKLVIIGCGEEENKLKGLSNKLNVKCDFKGRVTDEEKWLELRKSMFMVFPSSFEGFGIPPAESLICGKPCICSHIPIFHEVYQNKVEYFEENNVIDLAKKIKFLLNNANYRKKKGKEGKKYVKSKFSWKKSAEKIEKILTDYKNEQ